MKTGSRPGKTQELDKRRSRKDERELFSNLPDGVSFEHVTCAEEKSLICENTLRNLPEWFGIEQAILDYVKGVREQFFLTAREQKEPVGFISILDHNPYTSEIYVIAVLKEFQGQGLGGELIRLAEKEIMHQGSKRYLTVKTLSDSHPDPFYQKTRQFYYKMGFYPLEELKALWGEKNPCLLMIKSLQHCSR